MSEPFISPSPPLLLLCMGDDQELIKSKKPLKLGTWPRAIPFSVVVPDDFFFFFRPLYCALVHFRRSVAGQYNISQQQMQ